MKKQLIIICIVLFCFIGLIITIKQEKPNIATSLELEINDLITKNPNITGNPICINSIMINEKNYDYKELADLILDNKIIIETKEILDGNKNIFNHQFKEDIFSNEMYLYSMCFVTNLLKAYNDTKDQKYLEATDKYIGQFMKFTKGNYRKLTLKSSTDQSFFMRSLVFIDILKYFNKSWQYYDDISAMLNYQKEWLIEEKHFNKNNHGLMINIALIVLNDYYNDNSLKELGIKRTIELLNESFTEDGLNNENTPGYQASNIDLYNGIYYLIENDSNFKEEIEYLKTKIKQMNDTFSLILWQNNYYPPIGDGGSYVIDGYQSINQSSCFNNGYLSIFKDDNQYISFISNFVSKSHKQLDDLSVTYRYNNTDLLIDSGRYSYDPDNNIRKYVESCKGHSGICTASMDKLQANDYVKEKIQSSKNDCKISNNGMIVNGVLNFNEDVLKRNIKIIDKKLIISDSWELKNKEDIIIRFKFIENIQILSEDELTYKVDNIKFQIILDKDVKYKIEYEDGVYSYRNNKKENNKSLKIIISEQKKGDFVTKIEIIE